MKTNFYTILPIEVVEILKRHYWTSTIKFLVLSKGTPHQIRQY
jgi:hypothetical protein